MGSTNSINLNIKKTSIPFHGTKKLITDLSVNQFRTPKNWINYFDLYETGRGTHTIQYFFSMFSNLSNGFFSNCKLKLIKDIDGSILAGYTYKIRKNSLGEKSMYIDSLARCKSNGSNSKSKELMPKIYEDIKNTALAKKIKELTLFVYAGENKLRKKYESLGFEEDRKVFIKKLYLLRVRMENFYKHPH